MVFDGVRQSSTEDCLPRLSDNLTVTIPTRAFGIEFHGHRAVDLMRDGDGPGER